ncbi:MAG: DUF192 domain-containing protein [Trichodesmium sp. St18_bin3_1_1]|nr:DUF192 domain-containing protein [Trichodesmium sp. St18_bin3_1_1]
MFILLDMVFLKNGAVRAIFSNLPLCSFELCPTYGTYTPVDGVLELRAGRAIQLGFRVGDRINIQSLFLSQNTF